MSFQQGLQFESILERSFRLCGYISRLLAEVGTRWGHFLFFNAVSVMTFLVFKHVRVSHVICIDALISSGVFGFHSHIVDLRLDCLD